MRRTLQKEAPVVISTQRKFTPSTATLLLQTQLFKLPRLGPARYGIVAGSREKAELAVGANMCGEELTWMGKRKREEEVDPS